MGDTLDISTGNGQRFSDVFRLAELHKDATPEETLSAKAPAEDTASLPASKADESKGRSRGARPGGG
ncbi:MAG: hypothetical protein R3E96_08935 [Planctomycetota bacterium]